MCLRSATRKIDLTSQKEINILLSKKFLAIFLKQHFLLTVSTDNWKPMAMLHKASNSEFDLLLIQVPSNNAVCCTNATLQADNHRGEDSSTRVSSEGRRKSEIISLDV